MELAGNKVIKQIKSLALKKNRDKSGLFVVEGFRVVSEIPNFVDIAFYAYTDSFEDKKSDFKFRNNTKRYIVSEKTLNSITDAVTPQGIIAICRKMDNDFENVLDNKKGVIVILEEIKDPGNLGTIVRTADASGARAVVITKNSVDIYNPKVLRATMGSVFSIPIVQGAELGYVYECLKRRNIRVIGTSPRAERLYFEESFKEEIAIIIGSEAEGVSSEGEMLCDGMVKIPMEGRAESLNAGVAASILMYECLRQRRTSNL